MRAAGVATVLTVGDAAEGFGDEGLVFDADFFGFFLELLQDRFANPDVKDGVFPVLLDRRPDMLGFFLGTLDIHSVEQVLLDLFLVTR